MVVWGDTKNVGAWGACLGCRGAAHGECSPGAGANTSPEDVYVFRIDLPATARTLIGCDNS